MAVQLSYGARPDELILGQIVTPRPAQKVQARVARGLIKAGYGVFKVPGVGARGVFPTDLGQAFHIPNPGAAEDVDAFIVTGASAATEQTITTFDGAYAGADIQPARKIEIVLSNHLDWDATTATVTYVNSDGQEVTENLAIPNGGNATVTTTGYASAAPTSLYIPAQSGTGGTFTLGLAAMPALTIADFLGVARRELIKETLSSSDIYRNIGGSTSNLVTADFIDGETVSVVHYGNIAVFTEEAVADMDPAYVRVASGAGGTVLGAFRNDADSASCVAVTGARFRRTASAGVAWLELGVGY